MEIKYFFLAVEKRSDELIVRHEYPQVSPKVEYYLSPKGETLMPILQTLCSWGEEHMEHQDEEEQKNGRYMRFTQNGKKNDGIWGYLRQRMSFLCTKAHNEKDGR